MTTERTLACHAPSLWRTMIVALGVWFGALVLIPPAFEPTRDVFVLAPPHTIANLIAGDAAIVDTVGAFTRLRGETAGFVRRLYAKGAWLVVPALAGGCSGLTRAVTPGR